MSAHGAEIPGDAGRSGDGDRRWWVLRQLADRHAGYFTARVVLRAGCESRIRTALADGSVVRAGRGILRMSDWPDGPLDEYAMWSAWFEGAAAVSHHSAADLLGLGRLRPRYLHLSVTTGRAPGTPRLVVLRRELCCGDVESAGAFLVTTPVRTVLDLAETGIGQGVLDEVVADAVAIHRCAPAELGSASRYCTPRVAARVHHALAVS